MLNSRAMSDEGFHEIQLNGKQLVFLFMAATVVAVVIFLCGVMVGRGVQVQQGQLLAATADVVADPTISPDSTPTVAATPAGSGAPLTSQETLTYTRRLEEAEPPVETLSDAPPPAAPPAPDPVVEAPPARIPEPALASNVPGEPAGPGYVVQVAAVTERGEADVIARRLSGKGYPAFVTTPAGVSRVFRVRVGKFRDRREAEAIAARLEKEEQFKPWITR